MRRVFWFPQVLLLTGVGVIAGAESDATWRSLKSVQNRRTYTIVYHDRRCVDGRLLSLGTDALHVQLGGPAANAQTVIVPRSDVLRVGDFRNAGAHDAVFSGRSSWADVKDAQPRGSEYLLIVTKQGRELRWKNVAVSEDAIASRGNTVRKENVRLVSYVRYEPLSDSEQYYWREGSAMVWPFLWIRQAMLPKFAVLLYDAAGQEDNSPVSCR